MDRTEQLPAAYLNLSRVCGVGAILGGALFVAWGYIDTPGISGGLGLAVRVLSFVVPTLFLAAVVGLLALRGNEPAILGQMGMVLTMYAWGWSLVGAIVGGEAVWAYFAQRGWPHYLTDWLLFMLIGLMFVGIATARSGPLRGGALVLATVVFGWVYYLTDSGAVLAIRSVHVGFGLAFSLGWVALGIWLSMAGTTSARRPRTTS